ncbi:MAG: tRNA 2-thiouridine(34) synthase MnmA, partial [Lachnospiraceae bacterium]|nr:tRNA 2-thiouridine(34) synthase MnmA [Lachnospiraceae bacterium]
RWIRDRNWMSRGEDEIEDGMPVIAKLRYNHRGAPARIYREKSGRLRCVFEEEQRAVTPGQALVLYEGDCVLGGGTIIG